MSRRIPAIWNRLWFKPFDPLPAGLLRIGLGLLTLTMYLALAPNYTRYFGADGVLSLNDVVDAQDGWSVFSWFPKVNALVFWGIGLIAAIGFTVGWKTRLWTIVLFVLEMSMVHRNRFAINGEDLVLRMLLLYAIFAPLGQTMSLDRWLRDRTLGWSEPQSAWPAIWPIRLMQINIALVYAISLPNKLVDDVAWLNGDAIYYSIASNMWSRMPWPSLFYGVLSDVMTAFTISVEGLFPLVVWFRRTRVPVIMMLASLHIGIAIMLKNVTFFSLAMVISFCAFLPADTIRYATELARTRFGRRAPTARTVAATDLTLGGRTDATR